MGSPALLAQLPGSAVGVSDFRSRLAFRGSEGLPEGDLHVQLALGAVRGVWQGLEHCQPFGEVADGFHISRARAGALAGLLPVGEGLRQQAGFRIVMREQLFWLGRDDLGNWAFKTCAIRWWHAGTGVKQIG